MTQQSLSNTLRILLSDSTSLRELAEISGFNLQRFYVGADFRDCVIKEQDLSGLTFDDADFRGAKIDKVTFSPGAFNRSLLRDDQQELVDLYDFSMAELMSIYRKRYLPFFLVEFRPYSLERAIDITGRYLSEIANRASIGMGTLRNARRGFTVSQDTASKLIRTIMSFVEPSLNERYEVFEIASTRIMLTKPTGLVQFTRGGLAEPLESIEPTLFRFEAAVKQGEFKF